MTKIAFNKNKQVLPSVKEDKHYSMKKDTGDLLALHLAETWTNKKTKTKMKKNQ